MPASAQSQRQRERALTDARKRSPGKKLSGFSARKTPSENPQRTAAPFCAPITVPSRQQIVRPSAPPSRSTRAPLFGSRKPMSVSFCPSISFSQRAQAGQ